jgi:hypothetical protein
MHFKNVPEDHSGSLPDVKEMVRSILAHTKGLPQQNQRAQRIITPPPNTIILPAPLILPVTTLARQRIAARDPLRHSEGALMIFRLLSTPPQIIIIKDVEKETFGFPYGGREYGEVDPDLVDKDIFATSNRESMEEVFAAGNFNPCLGQENLIGSITLGMHSIHVFFKDIPRYVQIKAGTEQEIACAVRSTEIEEFIEMGIFLPNHTRAWQIYKNSFASGRK